MKSRAFETYLRQVRRHPRPSPEEEDRVARAFVKSRDPELAGRLVLAHLLLVVKIAGEYCRSRRGLADLVQEGNLGLLQAVQRYEPHRGVPLSSYAEWWIRGYMLRHLLRDARLVKLGTTPAERKLFFNLNKVQKRLEAQGVVTTGNGYLAEVLNVPERAVCEMQERLGGGEVSFEATIDGDPAGLPLRSVSSALMADADRRPDALAEQRNFRERLAGKLRAYGETLSGWDLALFRDRLLSESPAPLEELGARFGESRESARRRETRLLQRLRVYLQAELGDAVQELGDAA